jgi:membrane protease subunit HflC
MNAATLPSTPGGLSGRTLAIGGALLILGFATLYSALYTVSETEQVVITQFGEPMGQAITQPGLHVKLPFAQEANVFDKRWLEWNGNANQLPTRDKKYIWVETYARWRIANPLLFFQRLRDERGAQSRLDDIIDGDTRNVIANHNLIEVVRTSNRAFERAEEVEDVMEAEAMRQVDLGRDKITRLILERASRVVPDYGIELVDLQIQRVNYIESVQAKVFDRMISERKRIADRHRSEGQGKSAEIRGKKERELKVIESEAYRKTQEIMGRGDAEAAAIYAEAYGRDHELFRFLRTMETYHSTIDKDSWLVLSTDADLFRYMQSANPASEGRPGARAPRRAAEK